MQVDSMARAVRDALLVLGTEVNWEAVGALGTMFGVAWAVRLYARQLVEERRRDAARLYAVLAVVGQYGSGLYRFLPRRLDRWGSGDDALFSDGESAHDNMTALEAHLDRGRQRLLTINLSSLPNWQAVEVMELAPWRMQRSLELARQIWSATQDQAASLRAEWESHLEQVEFEIDIVRRLAHTAPGGMPM